MNTLQGRVITPSGTQPSAPVKVTLTFSGRHIYETFTDLSGRFTFPGLVKGTYQLTAEGDGVTFESTSVYAEVSAYGRGQQLFTQDIQLRPIAREAAARIGVVNAFSQTVPKAAKQAFEQSQTLKNDGKIEASLEKLQEAVRIFPAYFEAHLALGNHYLKAGLFDKAIAELDEARAVNPNDERLYQSFGLILMQQRKYPIAVAIFAEASRLNPTNPVNALMRATALIHQASTVDAPTPEQEEERKSLLRKAESALSEANKLSGSKVKGDHLTMALFYELKGEPARAADELEDLLRKAPTSNVQAIQSEINRLRAKAGNKSSP
jgi:tetratricopeptide (TPR) repeat protein